MDGKPVIDRVRPATAPAAEAAGAPFSRHELSGGAAVSHLTSSGGGRLLAHGLGVTRGARDQALFDDGQAIFVRDRDSGRYWSVGHLPARAVAEQSRFVFGEDFVEYRRVDDGLETSCRVHVSGAGVEVRRCEVVNRSGAPRRVELTSYLEWVLQHEDADASHPAFSKLFVETQWLPQRRMILARRRRRAPEQETLVGAHWVEVRHGELAEEVDAESNRVAWIGRGRSLARPQAMLGKERFAGEFGPVLDPIASLRASFFLAAGESAAIEFCTAAAPTEEMVHAIVARQAAYSVAEVRLKDDATAALHRADQPHAIAGEASSRARQEAEAVAFHLDAAAQGSQAPDFDDAPPPDLVCANDWGGFDASRREYVLTLRPAAEGGLRLPPVPWTHVVAQPEAGFLVTETGAGCTWTANSRENRITPWANDAVTDPPGEVLWLRDRDAGTHWSATPGPAGDRTTHRVRYGMGYAAYEQRFAGLRHRVTQFVPVGAAVKLTLVELRNDSDQPRQLDLLSFARLELGAEFRTATVTVRRGNRPGTLLATHASRLLAHRVTYFAMQGEGLDLASTTGDAREYLGRDGNPRAPAAVLQQAPLSGAEGEFDEGCFAVCGQFTLGPGESTQLLLQLGEADDVEAACRAMEQFATPAAAGRALAEVRQQWRRTLDAVQIDTPSPELNLLVNDWLPYQNLACRVWGRTAYYQSGGAYGFRDQLQDCAALVYHLPELTRAQILRNASHQFPEGDVLHWWHPPASRGVRTTFSDDLLWLPLLAAEYVATTGDARVWDESTPFLSGPALAEGELERFIAPQVSDQAATVYEHCCRAIDRSLRVGAHGLPLMGCGDWNDGMSLVGAGGRGESVWMGFFLHEAIERMAPIVEDRGESERLARYRVHQQQLRAALNDAGWDGQWFRRAYFDDGQPLGTAGAQECQIDALVQAWSVLTGVGDADKQRQAIDAVEDRLVDSQAGLIRLLTPPLDKQDPDPGYIRGYVPGVRENGGQYTHGVLWFVRALAELGRGSRAVELLEMLTPICRTRDAAAVHVYKAEPYVVAADVYGAEPHVGRAGWTWYTGSAGWMFRVAVESILGLRIDGGRELALNPCISASWPTCRFRYRRPGVEGEVYDVTIDNPAGRERGVRAALLDGEPVCVEAGVARVPIRGDGRSHCVQLTL